MNGSERETSRSKWIYTELDSAFGLFCLWDTAAYKKIHTADEWDAVFSSRRAFEQEISLQKLVPVYFYGYGSYRFCVRPFGTLTPKEKESHPLISQPYRLHTRGIIGLGGVEYIGDSGQPLHRLLLKIAPGDYAVTAVLPAMNHTASETGSPVPQKDFCDVILLLKTAEKDIRYRTAASTFYPLHP